MKSGFLVITALVLAALLTSCHGDQEDQYVSALGDPGMKRDALRVAIEGWNFCNEVGEEVPGMGSPRAADCFDLKQGLNGYEVKHRVSERDNKLSAGDPFLGWNPYPTNDIDLYAAEKEIYLGGICEVGEVNLRLIWPWQFWMIMLKNGNLDTSASLCPDNGKVVDPFDTDSRFPCFGRGCMNQMTVYHNYTRVVRVVSGKRKNFPSSKHTLRGSFYGSYDLDVGEHMVENKSWYSVTWEKEIGKRGWSFHHYLRTSQKYPWLMLYLRSDATRGFSGGYHYATRGMTKIIPESPDFKVKVTLDIKHGGGPKSQFYLMDMGSCWKNDGSPCDGDVKTDVTRYSEMILNPNTVALCNPENLKECPPHHTFPNGNRIYRNDTQNFPYSAYHLYCSPGNAEFLEEPFNLCDAYSNPQAQEIVQILPHPTWREYGYPTEQGQGWVGDPRTWVLDVGRMSQMLYFYQDPWSSPARRKWPSLDVGTEIYVDPNQVAEWTLSDFDILIPKHKLHVKSELYT